MSDESKKFDVTDRSPPEDLRSPIERKLDELVSLVEVVASHARLLERHGGEIFALAREVRGLHASLDTVISNQQEMNQLLAGIHSMWARLDCVRPKRNAPSSDEVRAVGGKKDA